MPEGPSIVILKEETSPFKGKKVLEVRGNSKVDIARAKGKVVHDLRTWGKQLLICFDGFTIRIHLMLFGSYRINEEKNAQPRLSLRFSNGTLNFYACSVKIIEGDLDEVFDWSADVMSPEWDAKAAKRKLLEQPGTMLCDAVIDQAIFAGSGNIFKNEVLFRTKLHPKSRVGKLPAKKLTELINEVHAYAFDFYKWKKAFVLKKHWQAHTKTMCPRDHVPFKKEYMGKQHRRTFFCTKCQTLYK